jgi:hypothetical protein
MRSHFYTHSLIFMALLILAGATTAKADTCFGTVTTLTSFIANTSDGPGTGCFVGDIEYYGVQFASMITQGATAPATADQIGVTFTATGFSLSGIPEVDNGTVTYLVGFNIDPAPVLTGDSISLDPPLGNVTLNAFYCSNSDQPNVTFNEGNFFCGGGYPFSDEDTEIDLGSPTAQATTNNPNASFGFFNPPVGQAGILLELILNADDPASIDNFGQDPAEASSTPEPGAWLLVASGLAFVTWRRRKRLS